jgi:hypothetical protein
MLLISARDRVLAQDENTPASKAYRNIKVLKDLPAVKLYPLMQQYNKDLGVTCEYCHVEGDFPKDTKPQHHATLEMIVLTDKLNQDYASLKKKVTCFTCHHGKALPVNVAGAASAAPQPVKKAPAKPVKKRK